MFMLPFFLFQKPDGLIFPDRATLYVTAIEDRQYKDYKIHCVYISEYTFKGASDRRPLFHVHLCIFFFF